MIIVLYILFLFNRFNSIFSSSTHSSNSDIDVDQFLNLSDGEKNEVSSTQNTEALFFNIAKDHANSLYDGDQSKKGTKSNQLTSEAKKEARRESLRLSQRRFIYNLKVNDPNKLREMNRKKRQKRKMKDSELSKEQIEAIKAKNREYARLQYQKRKASGGLGHTRDEKMKRIRMKENANTATAEELSILTKHRTSRHQREKERSEKTMVNKVKQNISHPQ